MILVDTSVWIDHFRGGATASRLAKLLEDGAVAVHPWVLGELSLGSLGARRGAILRDLGKLHALDVVVDGEVLAMIERRGLGGSGIGWVDAHLLASALAAPAELWTRDRRLAKVASRLHVLATSDG